ncbi:hypothetical protein [Vibrio sp. 10N]|uniref:hypothetical protein n=1 Tax=Vibrio sp. 10N TaxID=3058938 RepID=UPI002813DF01|nr:hypothetical protein VB10N_16750 [Vibrio sp. 10N]
MSEPIYDRMFRQLGDHVVTSIAMSESELRLTVAPSGDLDNQLIAVFEKFEIVFMEAESGRQDVDEDFSLPWFIIRFDICEVDKGIWQYGLCCHELKLGFKANVPTTRIERKKNFQNSNL